MTVRKHDGADDRRDAVPEAPDRVRIYVTLPRRTARKLDLWRRYTCSDLSALFEVWAEEQMGDFEVRGG